MFVRPKNEEMKTYCKFAAFGDKFVTDWQGNQTAETKARMHAPEAANRQAFFVRETQKIGAGRK